MFKKTWVDGELITKDKMNDIEDKIYNNKIRVNELQTQFYRYVIKNAVIGESVIVTVDSAEEKLQDFKVIGKSTQDGTPTPEAPQEIKSIGKLNTDTQKYEVDVQVTGKNLIPFPYPLLGGAGTTKTVKGITVTVQDDGGIKLVGTSTEAVYFNMCEIDFGESFVGDTNGTYCIQDAKYDKRWKTTFVGIDRAGETIDKVFYPQIEFGTKPTEYEKYREQSVNIPLTEPLRGIGDYKDAVIKDGVIRNFKELKFDGTEAWETWGANDTEEGHIGFYLYYKNFDENKNLYGTEVLSNLFKRHQNNHGGKGVGVTSFGDIGDGYLSISVENTMLTDVTTNEKAVQSFKEFLSQKKEEGKQLKVVINIKNKSKEPFPEEIKQKLSNLHTYYPTTVLVNDQNAGMELSYVADTKNYIDNKLKELVTANMQNTANLLSLMPLETQATMIENDTNRILENVEIEKHE